MKRTSCIVGLLMLVVASAVPAWTSMTIDFEAPTYTAAWLEGQDGWMAGSPNTDGIVVGGNVLNGVQSVRFYNGLSNSSHPLTGQTMRDGSRVSITVKASDTDYSCQGVCGVKNTLGNVYVACWAMPDGYFGVLNSTGTDWIWTGGGYYDLGDKFTATFILDFANSKYQLRIVNLTDSANPAKSFATGWYSFSSPTTTATGAGAFFMRGVSFWYDDLLVYNLDPISLHEAKSTLENTEVNVTGYVSALYDGWFNIEDGDRTAGFVVAASGAGLSLGQEVKIIGTMQTNTALGERGIYNPVITPLSGSKIIEPLEMTNKALGGGAFGLQQGVFGGTGLNNVGLLVKTTGRVSAGPGGEYFAIDDGSGVTVIAWYGGTHPAVGSYIAATGTVSALEDGNEHLQRQLILTGFQPIAE